jgi:hypothetical protein
MASDDKMKKQPMDFYNMSDLLRGQSICSPLSRHNYGKNKFLPFSF